MVYDEYVMNNKKFIFLLGILFFWQSVQAQSGRFEMGFAGGAAYNQLYTQSIRSQEKYEPEISFSASFPMQCFLTNWLAIGWDFSCLQKNYRWNYKNFARETTENTYMQLPVMLRFRPLKIKQFNTFISVGGFAAYNIYRKVNGIVFNVYDMENYHTYNEKSKFDNRRDQRFELGLSAGISTDYLIKNKCRIFVEARYYYGLTDLQQKDYMLHQIPRYNDTYLLQMGCLFKLKSKKTTVPVPQTEKITAEDAETETDTTIVFQEDTLIPIEEKIDIGEKSTENEQDMQDTAFVWKSSYYIQLFALKNKREIASVKKQVPVLENDMVVEWQRNDLFIYLIGVFPTKKEAEEKLEYYKKHVHNAFVTTLPEK